MLDSLQKSALSLLNGVWGKADNDGFLPPGSHCALTASEDEDVLYLKLAGKQLFFERGCGSSTQHSSIPRFSIPRFNDHPDTTLDDVLDVYELALKIKQQTQAYRTYAENVRN